MQKRIGGRWGLLFGLMGVWAVAQEPVPIEYRPTLAVLDVAASDLASIERAQQLESELISSLRASEQFEPVSSPAEVRERLTTLGLKCTEATCFEAARAQLEVQRVARLTVERSATGSRVTVLGLHPSRSEVLRLELDVADHTDRFENLILRTPAEMDLEFIAKVLPELRVWFRELATPNAKLIVENADPGLPVLLDGEPGGSGRIELIRPPGQVMVSISSHFYEPYDRAVTLKPGETTTVELHLLARPVAPIVVQRPAYSGLMSRPGMYLAMSGVTLMAVGLGLGISNLVLQERLSRPSSPVPVTRLDALNAPAQAALAQFFVISGAALSAGGITWIALTPSRPPPPVEEPTVPSEARSWTFSIGGSL